MTEQACGKTTFNCRSPSHGVLSRLVRLLRPDQRNSYGIPQLAVWAGFKCKPLSQPSHPPESALLAKLGTIQDPLRSPKYTHELKHLDHIPGSLVSETKVKKQPMLLSHISLSTRLHSIFPPNTDAIREVGSILENEIQFRSKQEAWSQV